jgi:MFS family permease
VYQVTDVQTLLRQRRRRTSVRASPRVGRTVVLLGLTSMFTDISSEMVAAILPLYLVFGLGLSPLQFGVVDGLYQGVAALVRVASGVIGDRWQRHKEVAIVGYGLSALSRIAMPLVGAAWTALGAVVMLDRTGKGIRTAPRDAMISLSAPRDGLATAFGVHRALDTAGAMLGPLVAFGILALAPRSYDAVFVASFCFALIGLAILWLFVQNPRPAADRAPREPREPAPSLRAAAGLLGGRGFRRLTIAGSALSLATVTDAFVYLTLQHRLGFEVTLLPLLYIATALVYMLAAVPIGRLADRVGRARVYLGGYVALLALYGVLLAPAAGVAQLVACLLLLGTYYAASEGVLMALASAQLPPTLRGTGLSVLVTGTSLGRLVSAIAFGALWVAAGTEIAVAAFAVSLAVALAGSAIALRR